MLVNMRRIFRNSTQKLMTICKSSWLSAKAHDYLQKLMTICPQRQSSAKERSTQQQRKPTKPLPKQSNGCSRVYVVRRQVSGCVIWGRIFLCYFGQNVHVEDYAWCLSVVVTFEDLVEARLPSLQECYPARKSAPTPNRHEAYMWNNPCIHVK